MRVDSARHFDADHFAAEVFTGINQRGRDAAIFQDALLAVDVLEKKIQRDDALAEAAIHAFPFGEGEDARDEVEREEALGALAVAVDGEGDALQQEGEVGELAAFFKLRRNHRRELVEELGVVRADFAVVGEHLIVEAACVVAGKDPRRSHLGRSCRHGGDCNRRGRRVNPLKY